MKEVQHIQTIQLKTLLKLLLKCDHVEGVSVCVCIVLYHKSLTQGIYVYVKKCFGITRDSSMHTLLTFLK